MKTILVLGGLAAAAGLAACTEYFHDDAAGPEAAAAPAYAAPAAYHGPGGQCFYTRDIRGHSIGGPHTIYLNVNDRQVWRVEASNDCAAAAVSSDPLIIKNVPAGISVCKPIDFDVGVHTSSGFTNRCIVSSITRLTPEEVAALPRRMRP